ncbi:MAG: DNA polymerase domain-containing protein, partial [Planctomycetota bacterium]
MSDEAGAGSLFEDRDVAKGEKRAASRHEQELEAGDVDVGKFDDSIREIDEFAAMTAVDDRYKFKPEREYYHGWSEGAGVVLLYRTETGARKREFVPYDWYFFVRTEEAERIPPEKWDWLVNKRGWADRVEPDPEFPDRYWRVYVDRAMPKFDPRYYFSRIGSDSARYSWAVPFYLGERPQSIRFPIDRDRWRPFHKVINWLKKKDVEPLEADLSVKQRFMTDFDLRIKPTYRMMFLDLETDDSVGGFDRKEEARILSIAWQGSDFEKTEGADAGFLRLAEETDEAEEAMLREFRDRIKPYDVLAAWNGFGFDFPVLFARFHRYRIRIDWRYWLFADPLPVFKRHYIRAGSHATSYALDAIGQAVLKIPKLEWRRDFAARHPDVPPRIIELYRREPELLKAYNVRDVEILRKLEEFTGFVNIEQIFCRIANGFANDWNISTKVDQLLLKKGRKDGFHYPTRFWSSRVPEQYEGAYVFPPEVGMHRNVGSFDFKSLYPSMVRSFNISPETIVRKEDVAALEARGVPLSRCPRFTAEGEDEPKGGSVFRRDREGFISQMFVQTLERRKKYTDLQSERLKVTGTTQDDLFLLYYRLAYSFKRMGLSFYGDMGNSRSRFYDTELAEAITLSGQFFILETAKHARKFGYEPLYGDTDSIYIQLAPSDREWPTEEERIEELVRLGDEFTEYCQERYLEVLEAHGCNLDWNSVILEYEDVMDRIFFVTKKRYAGRMLSHKGVATDHVEVKGLEVMRGDASLLTRNLQQAVLDAILMKGWDGARIEAELVAPEFARVTDGGLPPEEVIIAKGVSMDPDQYKTTPLHVNLAKWIRDHGQQFFVGMKVEYIVTGSKPKLSGVLVEHYDPDEVPYDPEYYWDRVIYPASLRILTVCFPEVDWDFWRIEVRRRREKLVARYRRWLRDPKKVGKAVEQIRENGKGWLGERELELLRRVPRVRAIDTIARAERISKDL